MISIVIPVYNAEKWIAICLNSILKQTYTHFELICVNDGSTDNSLSLLTDFAKKDSRVVIINIPKIKGRHAGEARNKGIKYAKGDYIVSFDIDDYVPADSLDKLLSAMNQYNSDIIVGSVQLIDESGAELSRHAVKKPYINIDPIKFPELSVFSTGFHVCMLIKRELLEKHQIFYREDCVTSEDGFFLFSLIWHIKKMTLIPDIVYYYRQVSNSNSHSSRSITYLCDDLSAYRVLYKNTPENQPFDYATYRFSYRMDEFFKFDLRYAYKNLSEDEKHILLEMLAGFFSQYRVGSRLMEFYKKTKMPFRLYLKLINELENNMIPQSIETAERISQESFFIFLLMDIKNSVKKILLKLIPK